MIPGRAIIRSAHLANVLLAVTAVPEALGVEAFEEAAIAVSLVLFFASIVVWVTALVIAAIRSARGDDIVVSSLFLVQGDVPRRVRLHLFGALGVCLVIVAATAAVAPFGILVPMLPLGLIGLWGARHGVYPPRPGVDRAPPGGDPARPDR